MMGNDLPGIVEGMVTYGMGRDYQLHGFRLKAAGEWKRPLCKPTCKGYKTARKCEVSCERGIILAARKAAGIKEQW